MQYLRTIIVQCLVVVATSLLAQESTSRLTLPETSDLFVNNNSKSSTFKYKLPRTPKVTTVNKVKDRSATTAIVANDDEEDVIVYNHGTKAVPRLTKRSKGSYEVVYDSRMVIPIWTQERTDSAITLPPEEKILRTVQGDDDSWFVIVLGDSNQFFVKPRYPEGTTSISVITKSGNRYAFLATVGAANKNHECTLMLDVLPPAWMKYGAENSSNKVGAQAMLLSGSERPGLSQQESDQRCKVAYQNGWDQAMTKHEDDLRDYATSIFHKANMDYKWGGNTKQLQLKRVFDDGRVTYLVFKSSLNIQPAFWEIDAGARKDVTVQRSVFSPEVMIVGKLFKEGVLSVGKGLEIRIHNKGWSLPTDVDRAKTQLRGDNKCVNAKVD